MIFAATEAKSGASTQRGAQSLSLLSLNDDVLSEIVSYLRDIDAINVAHSSKRLYCLAIAAVLRVVRCKDLVQLARFHRCMLSGPESSKSRALHLRALLVGTWSPYYRPIGYRDELTTDTNEGELAHLDDLFAILGVALHLRRLSWVGASWDPDLLDHLGYSSRLRTALASLSNLRDLELSQVTDREVAALPSLPTLEVLTLTYQMARWTVDFSTTPYVIPPPHLILRMESGRWATYDMALTRGFQSCSVLIEALRRMPCLRELALCNFYPGEAIESLVREPWYLGASFPTVSKLSLMQVAAASIPLTDLFTGLSHLFVDILEPEWRGNAVVQPVITTARRWPPLQSLSITTRDLELCGIERLNTVQTLHSRDLSSHDAKVQPGSFVRALSHLSPVHITRNWRFLVEEYLTPACGFWTGLHAYPPGLRSLDLVVWAEHNCIENAWHRIVPRKLAGLALGALRLILYMDFNLPPHVVPAREREKPHDVHVRTTLRREKILTVLLKQLFRSVSTLTVVGIAEYSAADPSGGGGGGGVDAGADIWCASECARGLARMFEEHHPRRRRGWDDLDRAEFPFEWWARGTHAGRPVRVPCAEDGERVFRRAGQA